MLPAFVFYSITVATLGSKADHLATLAGVKFTIGVWIDISIQEIQFNIPTGTLQEMNAKTNK